MRDYESRKSLKDQPDYTVLRNGGDPYFYSQAVIGKRSVLRNKYGVKDPEKLARVERLLTLGRLSTSSASQIDAPNDLKV